MFSSMYRRKKTVEISCEVNYLSLLHSDTNLELADLDI